MNLTIGQSAPEFSLYNTDKQKVSLSDYRGKNVVILFFPFAFTGVCTTELCNMRDNLNVYNGLNAEIMAISVDSVFTLIQFKNSNQLPFMLLSDFNKEVSPMYDAFYETFALEHKGVSKRAAFVVDKEGVLQYIEVLEGAGDLPNFDAIQSVLARLEN